MNKNSINPNDCAMFVNKGTLINGTINTQGDVYIEGDMCGDIQCDGRTLLEAGSNIKATVKCNDLLVRGELIGDIDVRQSLTIASTGHVFGNINCKALFIEEGAIYRGEISSIAVN